jgi:hypothetical protein
MLNCNITHKAFNSSFSKNVELSGDKEKYDKDDYTLFALKLFSAGEKINPYL